MCLLTVMVTLENGGRDISGYSRLKGEVRTSGREKDERIFLSRGVVAAAPGKGAGVASCVWR